MAKFETFLAKIDDLERSKFYEPRKKDLKPVVDAMQELYAKDEIEKLFVALPLGGVGKSYLALLYALFCAVSKPNFRVLMLVTSERFGGSNLESLLWLLDKGKSGIFKKYRWWYSQEEGKVEICKRGSRSTIYISTLNAFEKHYYEAKPFDIIVSDDISRSTKNGIYAEEKELMGINEKYELLSILLKPGGKEMHICSRIDLNDLFGWAQRCFGSNKNTKFISIPLINDDGTVNFECSYSPEMHEKMKYELRGDKYEAVILGKPNDDWKTFNEYIKLHPDCIKKRKG